MKKLSCVSGMKVTKISVICLIIFIFFICLIELWGIIYTNYHEEQKLKNEMYSQKIISLLKTTGEFKLSQVFDFEFDKAYVNNGPYADEKFIVSKTNASANVDIFSHENESCDRILFIKDNVIIYDYIYDMYILEPVKKDIWIYPDTIVVHGEFDPLNLRSESATHINFKQTQK